MSSSRTDGDRYSSQFVLVKSLRSLYRTNTKVLINIQTRKQVHLVDSKDQLVGPNAEDKGTAGKHTEGLQFKDFPPAKMQFTNKDKRWHGVRLVARRKMYLLHAQPDKRAL